MTDTEEIWSTESIKIVEVQTRKRRPSVLRENVANTTTCTNACTDTKTYEYKKKQEAT